MTFETIFVPIMTFLFGVIITAFAYTLTLSSAVSGLRSDLKGLLKKVDETCTSLNTLEAVVTINGNRITRLEEAGRDHLNIRV